MDDNYEYENFLSITQRSAILEFIMTKNINYYEDLIKNNKDPVSFCNEKNINILPSNDNKNKWNLTENNEFIKEKIIENVDKLKESDNIFDFKVLNSFSKESPIKFVYWNNDLKGIIHYSDYNRETTYVYLFGLILELEQNIRDLLSKNKYTEKDLLKYLKNQIEQETDISEKKTKEKIYKDSYERYSEEYGKIYPFQVFNLSHTINFFNNLIDIKKIESNKIPTQITTLRNSIMHKKNLIKVINFNEGPFKFDFDSFKNFRENVKILFNAIKNTRNQLSKLK
jgi:hypothetical protein